MLFSAIVIAGVFALIGLSNQNTKPQQIVKNIPVVNPTETPMQATPSASISPAATKAPGATTAPTATNTPTVTQEPASTASTAVISTSRGDITLSLYTADAPNTVANFISKAKSGYYKDLTFHRVEDWVVQGGDPKGDGTGGGKMATELNKKPFVVGSLGVARGGDITVSNDSQFFIVKTDASWLNNQYTNFGIVTKGMDVVNKMQIGDKILGITIE